MDVCDAVAALGPSLYPDELTMPLMHVAWRLESLAAGLWPASAAGDAAAAAAAAQGVAAAAERASEVIVPALMVRSGSGVTLRSHSSSNGLLIPICRCLGTGFYPTAARL